MLDALVNTAHFPGCVADYQASLTAPLQLVTSNSIFTIVRALPSISTKAFETGLNLLSLFFL